MELSLVGLRVLREVAERGSFTAAAASLGYTQPAVSRQVAALERATGRRLFDRGPAGVLPTAAGQVLALSPPFRLPDRGSQALDVEQVAERPLLVAVPATHPLAERAGLRLADLHDLRWIASRSTGDETLLGVWPGLTGRPRIAHTAVDWLAKLHLVAAGCGVTSVPAFLAPTVPPGVRLLPVLDGPRELRRTVLARLPGAPGRPVAALAGALRAAAGGRSADG